MRSNNSSTSGKKEKEKEKEKESHSSSSAEKDIRHSDHCDSLPVGTSNLPRNENGGGSSSRTQDPDDRVTSKDLDKFCDAITNGFDKLSNSFGEKLDGIGQKFSNSLNEMYDSIQQDLKVRDMPALEDENLSDYSWPDDNSSRRAHGDEHSISDTESNPPVLVAKKNYFKTMNKPRTQEKLGNEVDPDLAETVDRAFSKGLPSEEAKEMKAKYLRPQNVQFLRLPEVAENVYRRLPSDHKEKDRLLKHVQSDLYPVAIALTLTAEKIGTGDVDGGMETLSDSIALFGHVVKTSLTDKRRSLLKPKLPEDFRVLVSEDCPPTPTSLLGNVSENTKKVAETEKLATQMDRASKIKSDQARRWRNRSKPYEKSGNNSNNYQNYSKGKNSFFGKGNFGGKNFDNRRSNSNDDSGYNKNYSHGNNNNSSSSGKSYFQKRGQRR